MHAAGGTGAPSRSISNPARYGGASGVFRRAGGTPGRAGIARERLILDPGMGLFLSTRAEASLGSWPARPAQADCSGCRSWSRCRANRFWRDHRASVAGRARRGDPSRRTVRRGAGRRLYPHPRSGGAARCAGGRRGAGRRQREQRPLRAARLLFGLIALLPPGVPGGGITGISSFVAAGSRRRDRRPGRTDHAVAAIKFVAQRFFRIAAAAGYRVFGHGLRRGFGRGLLIIVCARHGPAWASASPANMAQTRRMRERDTCVLRLGFPSRNGCRPPAVPLPPVARYDRPTRVAGTAPRSSVLRACHCAALVEVFEELHIAAGEQRDRHAVAVEHAVAGQRGELRAGRQDADQVQRIGAGQRHEFAGARLAPDLAQQRRSPRAARTARRRSRRRSGRRGSRRALRAGDRRAAGRATAAARRPRARAGARTRRRSGAAACARRARPPRRRCVGRLRRGAGAARQRPAAGILHAEQRARRRAAPRAALVGRHQQRAQAGEAVAS